MTSHAVSRGRLAPLVGRRFVVVRLRVYFDGIQSLFAFILLRHTIMILFYCHIIGAGYITLGIVWTARFILLPSKKKESVYLFYNTYQHHTSQNVQQMVVFYTAKWNKRTLPPTSCKWPTCQT